MTIARIQNNWTAGAIDPLVRARLDIKQYQNAAADLTNCQPLPQGGFRRRPGLRFVAEQLHKLTQITADIVATYPNGGIGTPSDDPREPLFRERNRPGYNLP